MPRLTHAFKCTFYWNEHNQRHISFSKKKIIKSAILHSNVDKQIRKDSYNWIVTYCLMKFQDIIPFFYEKNH